MQEHILYSCGWSEPVLHHPPRSSSTAHKGTRGPRWCGGTQRWLTAGLIAARLVWGLNSTKRQILARNSVGTL